MDTQPELNNSKDIIFYLSQQFPNCFSMESEAKPLKIGIFKDLVARLSDDSKLSKTKLRTALRAYTISWRYLYSIKEGSMRVDLDGNACEEITKQQAEHASLQLKESKAKVKQKRAVAKATATTDKAVTATEKNTAVKPPVAKARNFPKKVLNKKENIAPKMNKVDVTSLKVGDNVSVLLGSKPIAALVSAIEKDHIKVKVSSGMELTVTPEHLIK